MFEIYVTHDYEGGGLRVFSTLQDAERETTESLIIKMKCKDGETEYKPVTDFARCPRCSDSPWFVVGSEPYDHWDSMYCSSHREAARIEQASDVYLGQYLKRQFAKR